METIHIENIGDITIRKLSTRDWENIRNDSLENKNDTQLLKTGTFIKFLVIYGINEAPFFKSKYPEKSRLSSVDYKEREQEYYECDIPQKVLDIISQKIKEYNEVDTEEIDSTKKN